MCLQDSSTSNITDKYVNGKCMYDFTVDKRQRKVSIATKEDIVDYCKSIVNTNFYGEVEPKERQKNENKQRTRKTSLFDMGFLTNEKSRKFSEDEILVGHYTSLMTIQITLRQSFTVEFILVKGINLKLANQNKAVFKKKHF